jgi:uncharacterized protein YodC (DUF2158 family)
MIAWPFGRYVSCVVSVVMNDETPSKPKLPKLGDIVRFKSGGPAMTVTWIEPENALITCRWFWRGRDFFSPFGVEQLEPAEPDTIKK